jgi:hypothetical protein
MTIEHCAVKDADRILSAFAAAGLDARIDDDDGDTGPPTISVQIEGSDYQFVLEKAGGVRTSNVVYGLWRNPNPDYDPRRGRICPPLRPDHPAYHEPCLICTRKLGNGEMIQLLILGPTTHEDRLAHYAGTKYAALQALCHAVCVQGMPPSPTE